MVYRLTLSYVGSAYAGWQRQPNAVTIQEVVERCLEEVLGQAPTLVGASRTDAGVHARGQVAHLQVARRAPVSQLVFGTNHHLPTDIRVLAADRMREGFHARKSAVAKEYRYRLSRAPVLSPLDAPFVLPVDPRLDLDSMRAATRWLRGPHDFTAFAKTGGSHGQPCRRILAAEWLERGADLTFRVVGDGFLRGMVRALVGTLIEVGRRRLTPEVFAELLEGRPRHATTSPTAPARGLTLERVFYAPGWEAGRCRASRR